MGKKKVSVIPAGYRLTISSWENDGDNNQQVVVAGISERGRVRFIVELLQLFKSRSEGDQYFGNMYEPDEEEIAAAVGAVTRLMVLHGEALTDDEVACLDENCVEDFTTDFTYEYLGASDVYWSRVFEDVKIEYIPEDIVLEDVTEEFV